MFYSCEQYFVFHCRYYVCVGFWHFNSKRLSWKKLVEFEFFQFCAQDGWTAVLVSYKMNINNTVTAHRHTWDRICCAFTISYMPPWWWPCRGRNMWEMSDKLLFIIYCAVCWVKYSITTMLRGMLVTRNSEVCCWTWVDATPMKCPSPFKPRWFLYVPPSLTLRNSTFCSRRISI